MTFSLTAIEKGFAWLASHLVKVATVVQAVQQVSPAAVAAVAPVGGADPGTAAHIESTAYGLLGKALGAIDTASTVAGAGPLVLNLTTAELQGLLSLKETLAAHPLAPVIPSAQEPAAPALAATEAAPALVSGAE